MSGYIKPTAASSNPYTPIQETRDEAPQEKSMLVAQTPVAKVSFRDPKVLKAELKTASEKEEASMKELHHSVVDVIGKSISAISKVGFLGTSDNVKRAQRDLSTGVRNVVVKAAKSYDSFQERKKIEQQLNQELMRQQEAKKLAAYPADETTPLLKRVHTPQSYKTF